MSFDNIFKLIFIFGIVYLFLNPAFNITKETFSDNFDLTKPVKIALKSSDNKLYTFVSFFDLKPEYQKMILTDYHNKFKLDEQNNTSFSFLRDENHIGLALDNFSSITQDSFSKIPIFIISQDDLGKYANTVLTFSIFNEHGVNLFTPVADKYLYYNALRDILYYSTNDKGGVFVKGDITAKDGGQNVIISVANATTGQSQNITNITPVQISGNNDVFTYYTLNNTPNSFSWILTN
jgi:hypothetical protein